MSTQVQIRRGNTAQTAAFTGSIAELTVDTDKKVVVVHDGTTAGGIPLSKESTASTIFNHANGAFDKANSANVLAQAGYNQANTATTSAQAAFDKANQTAQLAFTTVSANGTSLVADANNDTLTITSAVANGIFVSGNSSTDALDIGLINSGVTASGYGDSISVSTFVVDTKGRLTSASNTTIRSGTTSQTGVIQLEDSVTSTSISNAATPASVKTAYDLATTANNNAVNAGTYANAAFDKANSANVLAQSGYNQANTATTTAGLSYNHANGAFDKANTATTTADAAFAKANSANVIAQSAFDNSNTKFNSSGGSISGDVSVTGNLTIIGQTIYANTTTALIADNIITLNAAINQASSPTVDAGFEIDRGSSVNVSLLWNETSDKWTFTNDGTNYLNIADAGRLDSSFNHANGAFTVANSATTTAQNAYNLANGTAGVANTDFTTLTASAGTYGNASHVTVTTLTANGRVSSITNTAIAIDTAAITSGTLAVAQGGTGVTTSTGTGAVTLNTAPTITLPTINNIRKGYSTTATAAGTTTLTVNSNYLQFFTGTTTQTLQLPAPQTMTLGMGFFVVNNSTGNLSVIASNSAAVATILAGTAMLFVSIDLTAGNGAAGWSAEIVGFSTVTGTGAAVLNTSPTLSNVSVTGLITVSDNVRANYVVANTAFASAAGLSKLELSDIGLVGITVAGQTFQFGGSGLESNQGIFGGTFGGNRLSLNNETNLISNRYDTVKIQTGTTGTAVNDFVFANNAFSAPGLFTTVTANITSTTASTSNTTGALKVAGGIGVKGNVSADGIIFPDNTRQTTAATAGASIGDVLALAIALG